jgi:membrane fusion protein, heavy metal efflux system
MKNSLFIFLAAVLSISSCKNKKEEHGHEHGLEPVSYTLYSDKTELFVEFKPLVVGQTSRFAAHLTKLGEVFTPLTEGSVTVSLIKGNKGIRHKVNSPSNPGIFRPELTPKEAGTYELVFDIKTKEYTDQIRITSVKVYADEKSAMADQQPEAPGNKIVYLKEQAWKIEFANEPVRKDSLNEIIKTTGQILPAQGDETVLIAKANGTIKFEKKDIFAGTKVSEGELLFSLSGSGLGDENINARTQEALAAYNKAKADLERASELVKDKIISEKEFEARKLEFERAKIYYSSLSGGSQITAPTSGFLRSLNVTNGQFVKQGDVIGSITQNKNLVLKAELSQKYNARLSSLKSANIKTSDGTTYGAEELNIKVLSYGKVNDPNSFFSSIHFSIDYLPALIPGSFVELFIKGEPILNALSIPVSALIEEQGIFYVYVQVEGEAFEKREVKLGVSDGIRIQVLSGVSEGERVVSKGAYQVKLATMSGALPAHGHEH